MIAKDNIITDENVVVKKDNNDNGWSNGNCVLTVKKSPTARII
jgi:hypothetical protein